jgi:ribonuclease-3
MADYSKLMDDLGVQFRDQLLLESALTHRSFANQHPMTTHHLLNNERLEFLGDALLNYITADLLYTTLPNASEGLLTATRALLIKTPTLANLARRFRLGNYVRLTKGEDRSGARNRDALLADTFEAVLAAIYLDQGLEALRTFLVPQLRVILEQADSTEHMFDNKTRLQHRIQAEQNITPQYRMLEQSGLEHRRSYLVEVVIGETVLAQGTGHSKQAATQDAAGNALRLLDQPTAESEG